MRSIRDEINYVGAALLFAAALTVVLFYGCGGAPNFAPTTKTLTYHLKGPGPGPKEYNEIDRYLGRPAYLGPQTALVFGQYPDARLKDGQLYWEPGLVALVHEKDGTWTKYMQCSAERHHFACIGFFEKAFMPEKFGPGVQWEGQLWSGGQAAPSKIK